MAYVLPIKAKVHDTMWTLHPPLSSIQSHSGGSVDLAIVTLQLKV